MANTSNMSSETARRKAMGLSSSTSRRENGKVTENDIQEFLAETRAMVSKRMSAVEVEDFMYDFEKRTRAENPIKQPQKRAKRGRKKLPIKPKIDLGDSVVVVDKNENVSTVVPPEAKPQGNVPVEAKTQERQGDRQSFKGIAKAGALSLGSSAFNKMFPTLGKGLDVLKSRLEKQEKTTADNNVANKSYSRQVERSSVFLNTISENLNKTNDILQQILVVVNKNTANNQASSANGGMGGFPNIDLPDGNRGRSQPRRAQTVPNTQSGAKPRMSLGRAGMFGGIAAGVAGLGAWALGAFGGRGESDTQPEPPQAAETVPQPAPQVKVTPPTPPASQPPPAPAPGTTHDIMTGAPIGAPAAPAATRAQTPSPAATVNPAEAARAREEALNATAQRYQASVEEKASVERERAALEERYGQTDTERTVRPEPGSNVRFSPYKQAAYSDPEAQRQHLELLRRESQAEIQRNASFRSAARNVASTRTGGLLGEDADVTPQMIQALTTRYGYTSEQLQRYGGGPTQENFVRVGGIYYAGTIRRLFDDELKKDLERRAAAAQQPATQNKEAGDGSGGGEETGGSGGDATPVQTAAVTPTQNVTPAPAATPVVTPNATPVATPSPSATTEQSSNELTDQQKQFVDYFLRYNELQDNEEARSIAEYIVKRRNMPGSLPNIASRDLRSLVFNELRRRADRMGGMLIDNKLVLPGRPLTAAQMSSIERAGVQHYPQYVIDQYNRQKSGNATPELASETSTAATQQQIPEGATPVRSNDRVVGYMPEGGGPTVTFTDADRQTLEGARTQLTGSGSSATAAQPQQAQRVTEARTSENVNIQTFREKDPEGFQEFTDFVRNRQREIVREEIQKLPSNIDPASASMYRTSIESQARSIAQQEAIERFKDRLDAAGARTSQTSINGTPVARPAAAATAPAPSTSNVLTPPSPVTEQTATPESSGAVNPMTDPSGFNARILNVRAQEILFKADKFEYSEGFQLATGSPTPTPGPTPGPAAGGEGASSVGGSTPGPAPAAAGGSTSGATSAAPAAGAPGVTQIGSANITGLDFAAGVDQRINPGIADKTKEIQSAFGKKLMVTSGFRDPARNARVGGAGGSKHLTADAVDVQFPGNQQETIDLIKVASEKGAGGIGVYRPGFLHIDTGAKRVWGPDYKATSIPDWAKPALDEHMGRPASQAAGGGAAAGGGETASPMPGGQQQAAAAGAASPSAPAATPEPSAPSSGAAMSSASVADETASRPSAGPTPPPPDATAPITAAPQGPSLPGIDPNNPGPVEPADAAIRYSRLFNIAA